MDLATENRIALLLMQEATKLRVEAEKEGVHAYLRQPKVRGRPNSRFLTATVLGVQQANRAAEVKEMWQVRKKELEMDTKQVDRMKDKHKNEHERRGDGSLKRHVHSRYDKSDRTAVISSMPSKRGNEDCYSDDDEGLQDEEMEEFLRSRVKRGRGDIGSRMDETGPYLPSTSSGPGSGLLDGSYIREREEWEQRALGLDKSPLNFLDSMTGLLATYRGKENEIKERASSKHPHSKDRHRSNKDNSRDRKKKEKKSEKKEKKSEKKEKKSKRRHRNRSSSE